ncbi:MAG: tyrosine-type recombinase/integrase [bacterium]
MDIQVLTQKFCDHSTFMRGYTEETIKRYKRVIGIYCRTFGITELEQINETDLKQFFIDGRNHRKWKANTFICYHKTLSVFMQWCKGEGLIEKNILDDIETPKLEKSLPPKLTKQDANKLLEVVFNYPYDYPYLRYRNHAIMSTFLLAGIRKKELMKLKLNDVDLENMTLFVRQGKGSKDRIIPMCYKLTDTLKRYLVERRRLNKTCPEFFTSLNRNVGFTDSGMKRLVVKMRKASGIKFSIHKLRHTFATLMLEGGCDIYALSKMMGHSDIKTTTIYLAASAEHLRSQMTKHPLNDI